MTAAKRPRPNLGRPFQKGPDPRRGPGVQKGAPNAGAPKRAIRVRMRESLEDRIHIAESVADDEKSSASDKLRALDFLAKYSLGPRRQPRQMTGAGGGPVQHTVNVVYSRE